MAKTAMRQLLDFIDSKKRTKKEIIEKAESLRRSTETIQIRDAFDEGMRYGKQGWDFTEYPAMLYYGELYRDTQ